MIKKTGFILMSIFLTHQSVQLIKGIPTNNAIESFGLATFLSWYLSLCITGVFAFTGFALPTQKLMPESYYQIREPKILKKYYQLLRADIFQYLLIKFIYGKPKNKAAYFNGKKSGINDFIINTKKSEFGHLIPFIITAFLTLYSFYYGKYLFGIGLLVFNILGNFYPIIVQRYHRTRLVRMGILQKRKKQ